MVASDKSLCIQLRSHKLKAIRLKYACHTIATCVVSKNDCGMWSVMKMLTAW
jgi:hypothetical protein